LSTESREQAALLENPNGQDHTIPLEGEGTMKNPTAMTTEELADELRRAEAMAKELGRNWQVEQRLFRLRSEIAFRRGEEPTMIANPADEISQREKRRILAEDRQVRTTYLHHAESSIDDDRGGRFAAIEKSATVVGASPISYPQQPSNSPWSTDPIGLEPPLGFSVEDHDPVGELHEREVSAVPVEPTNRMDRDHSIEASLRVYRNIIAWLRFWSVRFPNEEAREEFERQLEERMIGLAALKARARMRFKLEELEELESV
jgi:hypothetical protein